MYKPAKGSDYVGKELFPPFCKHKTNPWITQSSHYCKIMLGKNSFTLRTTLSSVQRLARILHKLLQIQIGGLVVSERSEERGNDTKSMLKAYDIYIILLFQYSF